MTYKHFVLEKSCTRPGATLLWRQVPCEVTPAVIMSDLVCSSKLPGSSLSCTKLGATAPEPPTEPNVSCLQLYRCRANMARKRQSRLDPGLGLQIPVLAMFCIVPSSLESGAVGG